MRRGLKESVEGDMEEAADGGGLRVALRRAALCGYRPLYSRERK